MTEVQGDDGAMIHNINNGEEEEEEKGGTKLQLQPQVVLSSSFPLSEGQRNQLAAIRDLWRGTTMVMEGGAWTGEAREPQRKNQLLEQLKVARQLRHSLEEAAAQAELLETPTRQARTLLVQQTPTINTLVSLTEAVRGNYTLWSPPPEQENEEDPTPAASTTISNNAYHREYNEWVQEDRRQRQMKLDAAKSILRDQVLRMADPTKSWPKRTVVRKPPPSTSLHGNNNSIKTKRPSSLSHHLMVGMGGAAGTVVGNHPNTEDRKPAAKRSHRSSSKKQRKRSRSSSSLPEPLHKKKKKTSMEPEEAEEEDPDWREGDDDDEPVPDVTGSIPTITAAVSPSTYASRRGRKSTSFVVAAEAAASPGRDEDDIRPDGVGSSDIPFVGGAGASSATSPKPSRKRSKSAPKSTATTYKYRAVAGPKKCHNCKSYKTQCLKCQYMLPTGNKCGKHYCPACMEKDYDQSPTATEQLLGSQDWHCPACLGGCKCERCARQREREERRTQHTQGRQRSKRTIHPTNNFF